MIIISLPENLYTRVASKFQPRHPEIKEDKGVGFRHNVKNEDLTPVVFPGGFPNVKNEDLTPVVFPPKSKKTKGSDLGTM